MQQEMRDSPSALPPPPPHSSLTLSLQLPPSLPLPLPVSSSPSLARSLHPSFSPSPSSLPPPLLPLPAARRRAQLAVDAGADRLGRSVSCSLSTLSLSQRRLEGVPNILAIHRVAEVRRAWKWCEMCSKTTASRFSSLRKAPLEDSSRRRCQRPQMANKTSPARCTLSRTTCSQHTKT